MNQKLEYLHNDLEYYLWQTRISTGSLKKKLAEQIAIYVPELVKIGYSLSVDIYEGTVQDILYLNFVIKGYNVEFIFE